MMTHVSRRCSMRSKGSSLSPQNRRDVFNHETPERRS
jgi:hypothetical protein